MSSQQLLQRARTARISLNVDNDTSQEVKDAAKVIDDLTRRLDELEAERSDAATPAVVTVDLMSYTAVKTHMETLKADGKSFEDQRRALARLVRQETLMGDPKKVSLRNPNVQEELHYHRTAGGKYDPKEKSDLKVLASIPVFSGGDDCQWRQFEFPWLQAVRNRNISEEDLKTVLFQKLQNAAAQFYMSLPGIDYMSFGEIMQAFRDRYTIDRLEAQAKVRELSQEAGEKVLDYAAKVRSMGKPLLPPPPFLLKALLTTDAEGQEHSVVIPNPFEVEEKKEWTDNCDKATSLMIDDFIRGLQPVIRRNLPKRKYSSLQEAIEAARDTEDFERRYEPNEINSLQQEPAGTVNAQFARQGRKGNCHNCGSADHWKNECPQPLRQKGAQGKAQKSSAPVTNKPYNPAGSFKRGPWTWERDQGRSSRPPTRSFGARGRGRGTLSRGGRGRGSGRLPWNPRDPRRRSWMINRRARLNFNHRLRDRVNNLVATEGEDDAFTPEEEELMTLEEQLKLEDPEEYKAYIDEVYAVHDALFNEEEEEEDN